MFSMFPCSRRLMKILSLSVYSHPCPLSKLMENKYMRLQIYWILEGGVGKCITSYDGKVTDPKTILGNPWKHFLERKNSLRTSIQLTCTNLTQLKLLFCFVYTHASNLKQYTEIKRQENNYLLVVSYFLSLLRPFRLLFYPRTLLLFLFLLRILQQYPELIHPRELQQLSS